MLARVVPGRIVGRGCSVYVPAGGGYTGIVILNVFLCRVVCEEQRLDKKTRVADN